jgi:hypothetical protein
MKVPARLDLNQELLAVQLAREIAINLNDIEDILKHYSVSDLQWQKIQRNPRFQALVQEAVAEWNAAENTHSRVKIKAAAMVEEWLPEGNRLAHDASQPLSGKVELMKLIRSLSTLGVDNVEGGGEKFSVVINLGGDAKLKFEKDVTPRVIEGNDS